MILPLHQHQRRRVDHDTRYGCATADQVGQGEADADPLGREEGVAGTEVREADVEPGRHERPVDRGVFPLRIERQIELVQLGREVRGQKGHRHGPVGQPPDSCSQQADHYNPDPGRPSTQADRPVLLPSTVVGPGNASRHARVLRSMTIHAPPEPATQVPALNVSVAPTMTAVPRPMPASVRGLRTGRHARG